MGMTVLVVDDERVARTRVCTLLGTIADVERIIECRDGAEAVEVIRGQRPDIVFLDVQLPELTGFEVIQAVGADCMPLVVFVTAFDEYAIKAFEVDALDYLVKPFDEDRWRTAFERARRRLNLGATEALRRQLQALVDHIGPPEAIDRIAVKLQGRTVVVRVEEIDWLEARDNYVRLHVGNAHHLLRGKISTFEMRLDRRHFLRVHRGALVNVDRITEVRSGPRGDVVLLKSGVQLPIGSTRRDDLLRRLGHSV